MDKKGRRFADEGEILKFPSQQSQEDENPSDKKQNDRDKRLREKNSRKLEKKMKKQRKNKKRERPELVDDEHESSEPPEEEKRKSSKRRVKKKQIIAAALIAVVLFGLVYFAANPEKFSFDSLSKFISYGIMNNKSDEKFPIEIQGEDISVGNFTRVGQDLIFTSDTRTMRLNNYGRTEFSVQNAFIKPVLRATSQKALVYNLGGTGFQIISDKQLGYASDAPDNILVADINDSGVYALVTRSSGYLSKLYVYNEEHEQIFAYSFADYYVTSVSLNSTGRQAVVSGVSALDGVNISALYVLDFTKDTPVYFSEFENNIIYEARYLSDRSACAIGRSASYAVNTSNGDVKTYEYEGKALTAYDINVDTDTFTVSLSGSGDGRNCEIITLNSSGNKDKSFTVDEKIIDVSSYKGRVALLTNDEVKLYSRDGKAYNSKTLRSDPHAVALYTGSKAYVLCTGYIDSVSL